MSSQDQGGYLVIGHLQVIMTLKPQGEFLYISLWLYVHLNVYLCSTICRHNIHTAKHLLMRVGIQGWGQLICQGNGMTGKTWSGNSECRGFILHQKNWQGKMEEGVSKRNCGTLTT